MNTYGYQRLKDALVLVLAGALLVQGAYMARGQVAAREYVPLVMSNVPAAPEVIHVPIPRDISPNFTNDVAIRDRTGAIFASTRSGVYGGLVWKVVGDGPPEIVLELDISRAYGNGNLVVWPNGRLYYTTIPCQSSTGKPPCPSPSEYVVYEVPGWTP
jgi:hypothetical protein